MSSSVLKLIPAVPELVPEPTLQTGVGKMLEGFYKGSAINIITTEEIEFVDQGANFNSVCCNLCGQEIPIEVWQEEMDKASAATFSNLLFTTSCCTSTTSLNDLAYDWPAGFSKFVIEVEGAQRDLSDEQIEDIEKAIGCKVRKIWAKY